MVTEQAFDLLPFTAALDAHGDRPAVMTDEQVLTYRELSDRVEDVAARLRSARRLVALRAGNDLGSLVGYLGALRAGSPVLLVSTESGSSDSVMAAYDPDVILGSDGSDPVIEELRAESRHELHPELALLLTTSGSTGSPKLVRLSYRNLRSNAYSIAEALQITPDDRAATTLPMHYCYGLSVVHSHLLRGAALVLTDLSVVDPCFWDLFRARRATTFAAVPFTFELLDRVGFADMDLPHLRYVTQAGGRLAPEAVRRNAELGRRRGWDLVVMYGQTEATARMAYLPPHLAAAHPEVIGIPVPGGDFRIDPVPDLPAGELVYTGPNVMMGYALEPGDLAQGHTLSELRTGDLARRHPDGLYEIVGRRSRFAKIVGLRIDLGQVEKLLAQDGMKAAAAGSDERIVVAVEDCPDAVAGADLCPDPDPDADQNSDAAARSLAQRLGVPRGAVDVHSVPELPRLTNGKTDYGAVLALGGARSAPEPASGSEGEAPRMDPVRRIFAEELGLREIDDESSFVDLGGDSLSYVAVSVRLEQALGQVPPDWHVLPVERLAALADEAPSGRKWLGALDTSIVLRALAIVLIVGTHAKLFDLPGAAHVLMAVAGFNFARFQLSGDRAERLTRQLRSIGRIVVPSVAFIAVAYLLTDAYSPANIVLLNALVGPETWTTEWHFWFIEVLVYVLLVMVALLAVPWADRVERRAPFTFPLVLFGIGLLPRFGLLDPGVPHTLPVLWLFALGWAIGRADTPVRRLAVSVLAVLTVPGFFGEPARDGMIVVGILLLTWVRAVPVPTGLHGVLGLLAGASLHIYLVHWLVYPQLVGIHPALAVVASLAAGVGYWALTAHLPRTCRQWITAKGR
ncbi:AMP-binding protein [Brevibacterium daeguense]|uniref:AMP-binding protein n=1 Tax=Brevibacterium daeguense TaxID=909936 RepID=A0ABP8EJU9_9MICO|nr:AMP-binding protein [Brevibacterium daeguense]